MKKVLLLLLCAAMLLTLAACGSVKNVQTEEVASERYSQKDIEAAIGAIKKEFVRNCLRRYLTPGTTYRKTTGNGRSRTAPTR